MMSLKRVVLIAALVLLAMPAAALADGITFAFVDGRMYAIQAGNTGGGVLGSVATNDPSAAPPQTPPVANSTLHYVSRFSGNVIPTSPLVPPNGATLPPQIAPTFGVYPSVYPNSTNFGSVQWTTGAATSSSVGKSSSTTTYAGGGTITISSNGSLLGTGSPLFSGTFIGPTTFTSIGAPKSPTCTGCNFWYSLTGAVNGTLDPGLMSLLLMPGGSPQTGSGYFFSFVVGYVGPDDTVGNIEGGNLSVVVPEPGTLALFGTGLIGVAGFIRRRIKA
jgi:hypothetical protein